MIRDAHVTAAAPGHAQTAGVPEQGKTRRRSGSVRVLCWRYLPQLEVGRGFADRAGRRFGQAVSSAPMASSAQHIVVLGGGSSGEHFVGALRRFDAESRVTLVERRLVGGECSYWACMPTKTMLRAPELVAEAHRAPGVHVARLDASEV